MTRPELIREWRAGLFAVLQPLPPMSLENYQTWFRRYDRLHPEAPFGVRRVVRYEKLPDA